MIKTKHRNETGRRLSDRSGEHLRTVEGYIQNPRYHGGAFPVAEHFSLPDNNNIRDMRVSVVRQVKGGTATRQREERRLIFKLKTLAPSGINIVFKFIKIVAGAHFLNHIYTIGRA